MRGGSRRGLNIAFRGGAEGPIVRRGLNTNSAFRGGAKGG